MTAQTPETLLYAGEAVAMCTEPLGDYFAMGGWRPDFGRNCTALWRGYVGRWEITAGRLYMVGLRGTLADGTPATLATVFPGYPNRVFAHWYSGTLRLPQGKQLRYVHMGYGSTYEWDHFLDVESGVVQSTRVVHNGVAESADVPDGYGVAVMTTFPWAGKDEGADK